MLVLYTLHNSDNGIMRFSEIHDRLGQATLRRSG
jgi:DNA-binding HxlR family transcriptional regulator